MTGGNKKWTGKTLSQAHKGKCIQEYHYDHFMTHLKSSMIQLKVKYEHIYMVIELMEKSSKQVIIEDHS